VLAEAINALRVQLKHESKEAPRVAHAVAESLTM